MQGPVAHGKQKLVKTTKLYTDNSQLAAKVVLIQDNIFYRLKYIQRRKPQMWGIRLEKASRN